MDDGFARKGASLAVAIEGFFAVGWLSWASDDPPSGLKVALAIGAIVAAAVGVVGLVLFVRSEPEAHTGTASFRSRDYRIVVAVEVTAIVAGSAALGASGHQDYIAAWIALVVGVHFFPLARVFGRASMMVIGGLIIASGVAAFVIGVTTDVAPQTVAGGGTGAVLLVSALVLVTVIRRRAAGSRAGSGQRSSASL